MSISIIQLGMYYYICYICDVYHNVILITKNYLYMKRFLISLISILFSVVAVAQYDDQQYENAKWSFKNKQYDQCIPVFLNLVQKGYYDACCYLALCYERGLGVPVDSAMMIKYSEMAKVDKEPWFGYKYGKYLRNKGNLKRAKDFLAIAVENDRRNGDCGESAIFLGDYYKNGLAGEFNKELAINYYRIAAKGYDEEASQKAIDILTNMKVCVYERSEFIEPTEKMIRGKSLDKLYLTAYKYEYGEPGYPKDFGTAYAYYLTLANKNDPRGLLKLGEIYGNKLYPFYSQKKSKEYYKSGFQIYKNRVDNNETIGSMSLGVIYTNRIHDIPGYEEVKKVFTEGANQGDPGWQLLLAKFYDAQFEFKQALYWYEKSANGGNIQAAYRAGTIYQTGIVGRDGNRIIEKDINKAKEYLTRVSKASNTLSKAASDLLVKMEVANNNLSKTSPSGEMVKKVNENTFAIIIANENYQLESKVDYAINDGSQFVDCCKKVFNLPDNNVHFVKDATLNNIIGELDWLQRVCDAYRGEANIIFYYAGHGLPNESSGASYLLPVDGNSRILRTCFSLDELYDMLGKLSAKRVTILMDACFSGAVRNGGMLASARGVAIKVKNSAPVGNMIVMSAAQGNETAYKYDEGKHGLFTYFLLKKLNETQGNVTMGELSAYLKDQVKRYSIIENSKPQTPAILISSKLQNSWQNSRFIEIDNK